jgi:hypothetical protein
MANDLYGELLARALQRRAPPGHFPAFVTPGEANLLRSQGGGVAPGGGQFMAGGLPAFFSTSDPNPGYGGSSEGMSFGVPGVTATYGGSTGMGPTDMDIALGILGLGEGQAQSPHGHAVGEHGWSFEPTAQEISMAQQTLALHEEQQRQVQYEKQEARRVAAQRQATIEQDLARETQDRMNQIAAQSKIDQALARTPPAITVETVKPAHTLNLDFPHPGTNVANALAQANATAQANAALAAAIEGDTSAVSAVSSTSPGPVGARGRPSVTEGDIAAGMLNVTSPAVPGFTGTISEPGTESFFEESLEQDQTPYSGDTEDSGPAAQQAALSMAQHEVNTGRMSQAQAFSALDAPIDKGGLGRFSPAVGWGINSETGLASFADLAALNAQDQQGYAINNPQPSEASILASQVFAQLNPTITNTVIGVAGFLPGTVGFAATIAGLVENKGLINIPAVRSIPGVTALSDALAGVRTGIGDFFSPITEPIGQALSEGQQAVADALSGITGTEESTGFEDAGDFDGGGVDGGAPDIEIVPPIATEVDEDPILSTGTFADVDDETRRRILANIISGLQRTDRPTEGVTAFGPLFT